MTVYYCYECLRKYRRREVEYSTLCQSCQVELRPVKNKRVRAAVVTRLARLRGLKAPSPKDTYDTYLESPLWKIIRDRVFQRDEFRCVRCGSGADQVHHMSYAPEVMAGEDDSKLMSVCLACHESIHGKRFRRGNARKRTPAKSGKPGPQGSGENGTAAQCPVTR